MTRDVHGNPYCEYVYLELKMIWYWWCFDNFYDVSCIKDLKLALIALSHLALAREGFKLKSVLVILRSHLPTVFSAEPRWTTL
jgi:hypothetical protein